MSYSIFYDKQFIKLGDNIIPMILAGDNNCWTTDPHPKRTRDWQIFSYLLRPEHKFYASEKVLISAILDDIEKTLTEKSGYDKYDKREISREEVAERFGWHTSLAIQGTTHGLTAKKYQSFVTNGIKNALSIEELDKMGINLCFYNYHYHKDTLSIPVPDSAYIKTEKDFYVQLLIWTAWANDCRKMNESGETNKVDFSLQFDQGEELTTARLKLFRSDRRKANAKPTSDVEVDHYFVFKNENGYLMRYTKYGYKYAYHAGYSCKRYQFKNLAERYLKSLEKIGKMEDWKIEKINKPATFKVSGDGVRGIKTNLLEVSKCKIHLITKTENYLLVQSKLGNTITERTGRKIFVTM